MCVYLSEGPVRSRMRYLPTISRGQYQVLPLWVLANQQVGVCSICAPAHAPVEQLFIGESRKEPCDGFSNGLFGGIGIRVCGMFRMRPRDGD